MQRENELHSRAKKRWQEQKEKNEKDLKEKLKKPYQDILKFKQQLNDIKVLFTRKINKSNLLLEFTKKYRKLTSSKDLIDTITLVDTVNFDFLDIELTEIVGVIKELPDLNEERKLFDSYHNLLIDYSLCINEILVLTEEFKGKFYIIFNDIVQLENYVESFNSKIKYIKWLIQELDLFIDKQEIESHINTALKLINSLINSASNLSNHCNNEIIIPFCNEILFIKKNITLFQEISSDENEKETEVSQLVLNEDEKQKEPDKALLIEMPQEFPDETHNTIFNQQSSELKEESKKISSLGISSDENEKETEVSQLVLNEDEKQKEPDKALSIEMPREFPDEIHTTLNQQSSELEEESKKISNLGTSSDKNEKETEVSQLVLNEDEKQKEPDKALLIEMPQEFPDEIHNTTLNQQSSNLEEKNNKIKSTVPADEELLNDNLIQPLNGIPVELLLGILSYLGSKDILNLKITSKKLEEISKFFNSVEEEFEKYGLKNISLAGKIDISLKRDAKKRELESLAKDGLTINDLLRDAPVNTDENTKKIVELIISSGDDVLLKKYLEYKKDKILANLDNEFNSNELIEILLCSCDHYSYPCFSLTLKMIEIYFKEDYLKLGNGRMVHYTENDYGRIQFTAGVNLELICLKISVYLQEHRKFLCEPIVIEEIMEFLRKNIFSQNLKPSQKCTLVFTASNLIGFIMAKEGASKAKIIEYINKQSSSEFICLITTFYLLNDQYSGVEFILKNLSRPKIVANSDDHAVLLSIISQLKLSRSITAYYSVLSKAIDSQTAHAELLSNCVNTSLLTIATKKNHFGFVELILAYGGDPKKLDKFGKQPIDYATENRVRDILKPEVDGKLDLAATIKELKQIVNDQKKQISKCNRNINELKEIVLKQSETINSLIKKIEKLEQPPIKIDNNKDAIANKDSEDDEDRPNDGNQTFFGHEFWS